MKIKKILCPQDISENALTALVRAYELAELFNAELQIVHASDEVLDDDEETMLRISLSTFHKHENEVIRKIKADFENLVTRHPTVERTHLADLARRVHYSISIIASHGNPGKTLVQYAKAEQADLIVLSKTGHSSMLELLLGSVSTYILHHAPCPVLVIPGS